MKLIIDASVAVKWLLGEDSEEANLQAARLLLLQIVTGNHQIVQPPDWQAEVVAVLARRYPDRVKVAVEALEALKGETLESDAVYLRAAAISQERGQHLFDTLYHAVALEIGSPFVTADERYFMATYRLGCIERLSSFRLP